MRHLSIVLTILILVSCKLFQDKDTTNPIVNLIIEGGNEISRGVTLYLEIEDDSKINYVDIMIDDTTAATVTTNFDTIRFDVTPFADESEHQLYAKVADSEGNIGESQIIDVIITEFPGWRKYSDFDEDNWITDFIIDENDRIWISTLRGAYLFDINTYLLSEIKDQNGLLQDKYVYDIDIIEGSRVWIAADEHIIEYIFDTNTTIKSVYIPPFEDKDYSHNYSIAIDRDYNVWIGDRLGIKYYNHVEVNLDLKYRYPDFDVFRPNKMIIDDDNTLFVSDDYGLFKIENNNISRLPNEQNIYGGQFMVMDSTGDLWTEGLSFFDGTNFNNKPPLNNGVAYPLMVAKDGTIFTVIIENDNDLGIVTYKNDNWTYWNEFDSPFAIQYDDNRNYLWGNTGICEAKNGDIWILLFDTLWRYRPSLGGYP